MGWWVGPRERLRVAEAVNGSDFVPFTDVVFCPTGGISLATAPDFLALPNVKVCGGSWLTPADAVRGADAVFHCVPVGAMGATARASIAAMKPAMIAV